MERSIVKYLPEISKDSRKQHKSKNEQKLSVPVCLIDCRKFKNAFSVFSRENSLFRAGFGHDLRLSGQPLCPLSYRVNGDW